MVLTVINTVHEMKILKNNNNHFQDSSADSLTQQLLVRPQPTKECTGKPCAWILHENLLEDACSRHIRIEDG